VIQAFPNASRDIAPDSSSAPTPMVALIIGPMAAAST
jgi:hypothetical protein